MPPWIRSLFKGRWMVALLFMAAACNLPHTSTPVVPPEAALPTPQPVNLVVEQESPGQTVAIVQGALADNCTQIQPEVTFADNTFTILLHTQRQGECPPALTAFEERIPLPTEGLTPGTYRVRVGPLEQTFLLQAPPPHATGAPSQRTPLSLTPVAEQAGDIQGKVWHDLCASGVEGQPPPPTPPPGCVGTAATGYHADGVRQPDEPGIAGVKVTLAQGACPGTPIATTTTNDQGDFAFANLAPGTYCVQINPNDATNASLLLPGEWTFPADHGGQHTVTLSANATVQADFGWDYQFLPQPETCVNRAEFVDETIPDGTEIQPNTTFTKTWTLRNTGTCTWSTDYAAVFIDGDLMGAPNTLTLPQEVKPGETVTLTAQFTAPEVPGTYRAEWQLQDAQGQRFGLGDKGEGKFWVEIHVPEATAQLNLGTPTVSDPMNTATHWYLLNEPDVRFEMQAGALVMHGLTPGMIDWWGLSSYPVPDNVFIEATFITGPNCSGKDRYGLIVRAPDTQQGIILEFACNGRYRIYRWDGSHFTSLKPWTQGDAILSGPNQTNRMGVWLEGSTIKLYANRILLSEVTDPTYPSGSFGLVVASENTPDFTVSVDQVEYWTLP